MKRVRLIVNDHAYQMDMKEAKGIINIAKEKYKGKNVIVAVEKNNVIDCRKDEYPCAYDLLTATQQWIKDGYKVYSVKSYR